MKLHSIEELEHLVEIELEDGTIWPVYGVHEDMLQRLYSEFPEQQQPEAKASKPQPEAPTQNFI